MAAVIFNFWTLVLLSFLQGEDKKEKFFSFLFNEWDIYYAKIILILKWRLVSLLVCSGDSSECYKIDGAKDVSPKGISILFFFSKQSGFFLCI